MKTVQELQSEFITYINNLKMGFELTTFVKEEKTIKLNFWYLGTDFEKEGIMMNVFIHDSIDEAFIRLYNYAIDELKKII